MTRKRLLQFVEYKNLTRQEFYDSVGFKRGILDADKRKSAVKDTDLAKILAIYPELDLYWLILGEGEMLKNVPAPEPALQESHAGADRYTASLEKQIALLEKNNALQERENTYLLEKIKNLQEAEKEAQTPCDEIKIIAEERASIIDMQKDKIDMQNKIIEDLELKLQKLKKEEESIEKHSEKPTLLEV